MRKGTCHEGERQMHDHEGRSTGTLTRRTLLEAGALAAAAPVVGAIGGTMAAAAELTTKFAVDPFWPKPLPDKWITGEVAGSAVDANDHLWTVNRRNLTETEQRMVIEGEAKPS